MEIGRAGKAFSPEARVLYEDTRPPFSLSKNKSETPGA
jgi:hypothetical protein